MQICQSIQDKYRNAILVCREAQVGCRADNRTACTRFWPSTRVGQQPHQLGSHDHKVLGHKPTLGVDRQVEFSLGGVEECGGAGVEVLLFPLADFGCLAASLKVDKVIPLVIAADDDQVTVSGHTPKAVDVAARACLVVSISVRSAYSCCDDF